MYALLDRQKRTGGLTVSSQERFYFFFFFFFFFSLLDIDLDSVIDFFESISFPPHLTRLHKTAISQGPPGYTRGDQTLLLSKSIKVSPSRSAISIPPLRNQPLSIPPPPNPPATYPITFIHSIKTAIHTNPKTPGEKINKPAGGKKIPKMFGLSILFSKRGGV